MYTVVAAITFKEFLKYAVIAILAGAGMVALGGGK